MFIYGSCFLSHHYVHKCVYKRFSKLIAPLCDLNFLQKTFNWDIPFLTQGTVQYMLLFNLA